MQSLQQKASEWSGVAASDAFAIDDTNIFQALGGIQPFIDLSTNFYNRWTYSPWDFLSLGSSVMVVGVWPFGSVGSTMTRRSGSGRSLLIRRRRMRSRTSTSSSCRGWEAPISIPRGKVMGTCHFVFRCSGMVVSFDFLRMQARSSCSSACFPPLVLTNLYFVFPWRYSKYLAYSSVEETMDLASGALLLS